MAGESVLRNLCELIVDCPHSTPAWTLDGVVVLRSHNIRKGRLNLCDPSFTNEEHYQQRVRRAVPRGGDIVISIHEASQAAKTLVTENFAPARSATATGLRSYSRATVPSVRSTDCESARVLLEIGRSPHSRTTFSPAWPIDPLAPHPAGSGSKLY